MTTKRNTTERRLPPELLKRRRNIMISPVQEAFVKSIDPHGMGVFANGLAEVLKRAGFKEKPSKK